MQRNDTNMTVYELRKALSRYGTHLEVLLSDGVTDKLKAIGIVNLFYSANGVVCDETETEYGEPKPCIVISSEKNQTIRKENHEKRNIISKTH